MRTLLLLAALSAGVASAAPTPSNSTSSTLTSSGPTLYTVNQVQYVNPYDFAATYGGKVSGKSVGPAWVLSVGDRNLRLINNSDVAYLNGQRVQLSKVVAYARGRLLAPYGDLARLLNVGARPAQAAVPTPSRQAPKTAASIPPKPLNKPATALQPAPSQPAPSQPAPAAVAQPAATPAVQAAKVQPAKVQPANVQPANVQPANVQPAQPSTARAAKTARAPLDPYVIESDIPSRTEDLVRANYQAALGGRVDVNGVVQACLNGAGEQLNVKAPTLAARPFVFVHPDNVYSVRSSVQGENARGSFTCLAQVQGDKLVAFVEVRASK